MSTEKKIEEHVDRKIEMTGDSVEAGTGSPNPAPTPDDAGSNKERPAENSTNDAKENLENKDN